MKVNKTAIICMGIFVVVTLLRLANHIPWFDEAHAWTIAEQLNYIDMFNYVKNEGHFFLWQTLLYPFAHSNIIPYPYPMQGLNWIFCFSALVLMWWKAPFNNWVKALITFSFPFLGCFSIVARCYSIGILLLFILAALYDKKIKYPKTYALLLILCANTSVIALIGATTFGILFLIDILKKRLSLKNSIIVASELLFGGLLIVYQIFNIDYWNPLVGYKFESIQPNFAIFDNTFVYSANIINIILLCLFAIPLMIYFYKNKSALFFILFSYVSLITLNMFFYEMHFWHSYFFYIYLIVAFWICNSENDLKRILAVVCLAVISFWLIFHVPHKNDFEAVYKTQILDFFDKIKEDKVLTSAKIIHNCPVLYEFLPYSKNKKLNIKSYCNADGYDYRLPEILGFECVRNDIFGQVQKYPDIIKNITDENTYAYAESDKALKVNQSAVIIADGYSIIMNKYKCFGKRCFWKVDIK